ncbi:MAG: hypothetical protein EOO71_30915 [Myxococcaceae bacterium]|nr:MAG: hypothetical protein EOO71_30915 [Myxococcaceae bacterium]
MIEENIIDAPADEALYHLKRSLNGYRYNWERIYIGVTAWPEDRWDQHLDRDDGWEKMVLLYDAWSTPIAEELERALIKYARECRFKVSIENIRDGGESLSRTRKNHFLYVLVG